ncbi:MAG TPA: NMD3-related protein, partial [archaeon]|nr:NMD3-related protein [archaeon]
MKRYCPKCGKEITDENSINNFCIDCYMQEHKIIQIPEINISICVKCGKIKFQGKYYNNKEDIEKIIQKNIKVNDIEQARAQAFLNLDLENNKNNYILVIVQGLLGNKITQIKQQIPINLKKETCVSCSRTAGKYYTTILQIRFNDKETQEKMESEIYNKLMEIINNTNENTADPEKQIHLTKNVT